MRMSGFWSCRECVGRLRIETHVNLVFHSKICGRCDGKITCFQYMNLLIKEKGLEDIYKQMLTDK